MTRAADRIEARLKTDDSMERADAGDATGLNVAAENAADEETRQLQRTATRRIEQLLDALKPDMDQVKVRGDDPSEA